MREMREKVDKGKALTLEGNPLQAAAPLSFSSQVPRQPKSTKSVQLATSRRCKVGEMAVPTGEPASSSGHS